MPKKIVLLSDGTGNSSAKVQRTNVWRLFKALDQTKPEQIAKYDDGVGTSRNKYLAVFGGAFGWGLKRNVLDLYKFVCRTYETGDDIYGFGFSRGAFTIRVLVDLISTEGLVDSRSEEELGRNAVAAYRHYRSEKFPSPRHPFVFLMRGLRDSVLWLKDRINGYSTYGELAAQTRKAGRAEIPIKFLGLWDTVEAYGVPIAELKRGIDRWLWPMVFGDHVLPPCVRRTCHALSLDDERTTFHPLLWDEVDEAQKVEEGLVAPGRITQVWFAGAHSNVGGGYPEDQLSLVSLEWMMGEAIANGMALDEHEVSRTRAAASPYARLYDSRAGFASYYRYSPRRIRVEKDCKGNHILPIIHGSVVMRMAHGADRYAPISLPHEFWVLAPDGELLPMEGVAGALRMDTTKKQFAGARAETKVSEAVAEARDQLDRAMQALSRPNREAIDVVWDTVFWRRFNYFVTVIFSGFLVAYPLVGPCFHQTAVNALKWLSDHPVGRLVAIVSAYYEPAGAAVRGPIKSVVEAFGDLLPGYAAPWTNSLQAYPVEFAIFAAVVAFSLLASDVLEARIRDRAWFGWHSRFRRQYLEWSRDAQKGWIRGVLAVIVIAALGLGLAVMFRWSEPVICDLALLVASLCVYLIARFIFARPAKKSEESALEGNLGLRVARCLRERSSLQAIYKWVFNGAVPFIFAVMLVVAALIVANHVLFHVVSVWGANW